MQIQSLLLITISLLGSGAALAGSLTGPILDVGLRVEIEDFLRLPATSPGFPRARVNVLREAPDGSDRIFVNDLRGPLYVLDGTTLHLYLDLSAVLPLKIAPNIGTGFASYGKSARPVSSRWPEFRTPAGAANCTDAPRNRGVTSSVSCDRRTGGQTASGTVAVIA